MSHITNASSDNSYTNWESIKDTALKDKNLTADIRVGVDSITVVKQGFWEKVKAFFGYASTPTIKQETLDNLKGSLKAFFNAKIGTLIDEIGVDRKSDDFNKKCEDLLTNITSTLGDDIKELGSTSAVIQMAHIDVLRSLASLKKTYATPDVTPSFYPAEDGKISVIRPAPNLENVVFSGGGKKGDMYGVIYKVLTEEGALSSLKRVAGSSAGAMAATCVACGMNSEEFDAVNASMTPEDLSSSSKNKTIDQSVSFSTFAPGWNKGTQVIDKMNNVIKKFVRTELLALPGEKLTQLKPGNRSSIIKLQGRLEDPNYMITFGDLAILREMNPAKFKELTITGFNKTEQKMEYYKAETHADMPIAVAVRISIALPVAFKPVLKDGKSLQDGGTGSNQPVEALNPNLKGLTENIEEVSSKSEKDITNPLDLDVIRNQDISAESANAKTLVLAFDKKGGFSKITSQTRILKKGFMEDAKAFLSGNHSYKFSAMADKIKLWNAGPNAMGVHHGTVGTTDFKASSKTINAAKLQATTRAWEWASLRQNQATYEVFDAKDLPKIMASMSKGELEGIIKQNPESPRDTLGIGKAAQEALDKWRA